MKTKIKYIILAAFTIGLLFGLSSCKEGDEITRTLEVDQPSITMDKGAQIKSVKITVDEGVQFSAEWKGDNWGNVTTDVNAGLVKIAVLANDGANTRFATVVVTVEGGLRNKIIEISQSSDDIIVVPDEITFDFMGGEFIVKVDSRFAWEALSDVEWLEISSHLEANDLVVKASPNESDFSRSTTIIIVAGIHKLEVVVTQGARPLFLLPYLNSKDATFKKLLEFEEARHSSVILGNGNMLPTKAYTKSPLMPIIKYDNIGDTPTRLDFASIDVQEEFMPGFFGEGESKGKVYDLFLESGFEYLMRLDNIDYYWVDCGEDATHHYLISIFRNSKVILYEKTAIKPILEAPTFDVFPYPDTNAIPWGSHQSVAKAWEGSNSGVLFAEDDEFLAFNVTGSDLYKMRYYHYYGNYTDMYVIEFLFQDITKLLIKHPTSPNRSINPALNQLIISEGFIEIGLNTYENVAKELQIIVFAAPDPNLLPEEEVICGGIAYIYFPPGGGAAPKEFGKLSGPRWKYIPLSK